MTEGERKSIRDEDTATCILSRDTRSGQGIEHSIALSVSKDSGVGAITLSC